MRRRTFDLILTGVGVVLTIVLLLGGVALTVGYNFAHNEVKDQLTAQQIYFPAKGSDALKDPKIGPYLEKYAGQQLTTGEQAKAYSDHFIAVHLDAIGGGKTYAQLSAEAQKDPTNAQLKAQVDTLFKGETLRGLLLNAYAFDTMATVAGIAALVAFGAAGVMLLLSVLGFVHARRTDEVEELGSSRQPTTSAKPVTA
jgi:hypothetical protein